MNALRGEVVALARIYGRHGHRRVAALLRVAGWCANPKRVERIWREEGLKVPPRQPKRGRLWHNDGSCVRLRPERPNHVWAYDFVEDRTRDGRKFRILCVVDEFTREALRYAQLRRDVLDAGPTARGAQKFPDAASFRITFSSVRSATALRSRAVSASSCSSRFTRSSFSPPNSARQR